MAAHGVTIPPALDATMQEILNLLKGISIRSEIVDNLTTGDSDKALSARQGKILNEAITSLMSNIEKVWENQNPSDSFGQQHVLMDLSAYKFVILIYRESTSLVYEHTSIARVGGQLTVQSSYQYGPSAIQFVMRGATISTDRVAFTQGYMTTMGTANFTATNTILIPYMVYGIKY